MTYIEKPKGGAVFSVGSITYCGSLPANKFDNDVSRLTFNVINRFGELNLKWPF
jgi:N,N-dimethylformamidase